MTSYVYWKKIIPALNEDKMNNVMLSYVTYLMNNLQHLLNGTKHMYALYNSNSISDFDDSIGIDIIRVILGEFRKNKCIARLLHESHSSESRTYYVDKILISKDVYTLTIFFNAVKCC